MQTPFRIISSGSGTPLHLVESYLQLIFFQSKCFAPNVRISYASCNPFIPVQAFAFSTINIIACNFPSADTILRTCKGLLYFDSC
ncbi:hypothetical protein CW304_07120 [Bacillus sp. UFRGS-B20]|nr:hypothetical protein CW304_07120 [Bacillus sp. UFRGS-B20]